MNLNDVFSNAYVISLQNDDRLSRFFSQSKDFPSLSNVRVFQAFDGDDLAIPDWWAAGANAYGCFRSHIELWKNAVEEDAEILTVFEDDALLRYDFADVAGAAVERLPNDWDILYLGGQQVGAYRPIAPHLTKCRNVNRLHGYVVNGRSAQRLYDYVASFRDWSSYDRPGRVESHIDHQLGRLATFGLIHVYAVRPWVVIQDAGYSNIMKRMEGIRAWDY